MVNKVLLVLHSLLALATSSDIWTALYSAEECIATALIDDAIVASGACVSGQLSDGTTASAKFQCSGDTESSPWSAGVYLGASCSGFKIMTLSADDACTCGSSAVFGYAISAYASCAGTAPECFLNPTEPKVWGAVYRAADCDPQSLVLDSTLVYGDCVGGSLPNGAKVSAKFVCHGHTAASSWDTKLYLSEDCTGISVVNLESDDACSCASTSLMGYADVSAYVSCDGLRPDCFERYPTDDKYDDVSDTPVSLSMYSGDSCADSNMLGTQDTTNGQSGCTSVSTSLGDIGLVVYCDIEATDGAYTYRAEMFSSADCAGEPFSYNMGTAETCIDIMTAASFEVRCGSEENNGGGEGDTSSNGTGANEWAGSSTMNVVVIVIGVGLLIVCGFVYYKFVYKTKNDSGSAAEPPASMTRKSKYGELDETIGDNEL